MCKVCAVVSVSMVKVLVQQKCDLTQHSEQNLCSQKESRYKVVGKVFQENNSNTGA